MISCFCMGLSKNDIKNIIKENSIRCADELSSTCGAGLVCGACREELSEMVMEENKAETAERDDKV